MKINIKKVFRVFRESSVVAPEFDRSYYLSVNGDVAQKRSIDPVKHYCEYGWREGRDPAPSFSTNAYLQVNPDVKSAGVNPFWHYIKFGREEGRAKHPVNGLEPALTASDQELDTIEAAFDKKYYRQRYPDLSNVLEGELVRHYCEKGWGEDRDPSPNFSTSFYLHRNPDVAAAKVNPFYHYLTLGEKEGRSPLPESSLNFESLSKIPARSIPWAFKSIDQQDLESWIRLIAGSFDPEQKKLFHERLNQYREAVVGTSGRSVCYTAQFGAYDTLQPVSESESGVDYVCFTDNAARVADGYRVLHVPPLFDDPTRSARVLKALPHLFLPKAEQTLWIDGSTLIRDPGHLFARLEEGLADADILLHSHSQRMCVYDEAVACKALKKDDDKVIDSMMASIYSAGFPRNMMLFETAQLLRRNTPEVALFNERWWSLMREFSRRDQLSFPFVAWRMEPKIKLMSGTQWIDPNFKNYLHAETGQPSQNSGASTAIIMLVRDQEDLTRQAIDTLTSRTLNSSYQLFIIDNASQEETRLMLEDYEAEYPSITVIRNSENKSFSTANNEAAQLSDSDYLCFINNDIEIRDSKWLDRLINSLEVDQSLGAVGPILLFPDFSVQSAGIDIRGRADKIILPADECKTFRQSRSVDALSGGCLLVRRTVHNRIGGFDERFWYGQEDIDYCLRLREAGYNLKLVSEAEVIHHESKSRSFNHRSSKNRKLLRDKWDSRFGILNKTIQARADDLDFRAAVAKKPLRYRSYADVSRIIRRNIHNFPFVPDLVVGIPRSGLIPATMIAQLLNVDLMTFEQFASGISVQSGDRPRRTAKSDQRLNVLVVDDSINSGRAFERALARLPGSYQGRDLNVQFMAVFGSENWYDESKVLVLERCLLPRIFQWNYLNHGIARFACFDMDGVLCADPSSEQNDDGRLYLDFLRNAQVRTVPTYPICAIVTSRLEKYRAETEDWLGRHGVKYNSLYMIDLPSAEERRRLKAHAPFKAEVYKELKDTRLFVESEPSQARAIFEATNKPVICTEDDSFYSKIR